MRELSILSREERSLRATSSGRKPSQKSPETRKRPSNTVLRSISEHRLSQSTFSTACCSRVHPHVVRRFFADILLTPLEATRIRLVSDPKYASGLVSGFTRLASEEGLQGLYAGFLPILCKYVSLLCVHRDVDAQYPAADRYRTPLVSSP